MRRLEGTPEYRQLPTHPVLANLLTLEPGRAYEVGSLSAAMLLLAGPSGGGSWCAAVGLPWFGVEAATEMGVSVDRLVTVPAVPAEELTSVIAALIDVVDVVLTAPFAVPPTVAARLAARARERGSVLITLGNWERAAARLTFRDTLWTGVGAGHGHLRARQVTLDVHQSDRLVGSRRIWLPDDDLQIREVEPLTVLRGVS